jgi:hypothetical protein
VVVVVVVVVGVVGGVGGVHPIFLWGLDKRDSVFFLVLVRIGWSCFVLPIFRQQTIKQPETTKRKRNGNGNRMRQETEKWNRQKLIIRLLFLCFSLFCVFPFFVFFPFLPAIPHNHLDNLFSYSYANISSIWGRVLLSRRHLDHVPSLVSSFPCSSLPPFLIVRNNGLGGEKQTNKQTHPGSIPSLSPLRSCLGHGLNTPPGTTWKPNALENPLRDPKTWNYPRTPPPPTRNIWSFCFLPNRNGWLPIAGSIVGSRWSPREHEHEHRLFFFFTDPVSSCELSLGKWK